ncbi:glycosyltransferase [Microbacterium sulfonylureivorans]|uniref:glycosyltransferase n=1 Tax=Microbacterium sulfonylureivorans TaxID=2486854 RepID=UPI0013E09836|nr:glycosyltransferase [Microbacterium sulfonylureivorans]
MVWRDLVLPGSETFIRNQVDAMTRWEPVLAGVRSIESPIRRDTDVVLFDESFLGRVERRLFSLSGWSPRLDRLLKRRGVTLIHAHFGMGAVSIARTARRLGIPLIVTVHGNDVTRTDLRSGTGDREGRAYARRLTAALRYATSVIAVSHFIARQVCTGYAVPAHKVTVLRIGVPTASSPEATEPQRDILFAGRLVAKKGVSDLLTAVELAGRRIPPPSVTIIGDGKLREQLEAEARARGVNATFVGARSPDEVEAAMRSSLLFVAPSRTAPDGDAEGFGMVFLEAARAGRPVIAYDHGGVGEAVVDGVTGVLVPEGDTVGLADAIARLLGDAELRSRMGDAGRRRVVDEFDIRACTAELEDEFDRVAGAG